MDKQVQDQMEIDDLIDTTLQQTGDIGKALLILRDKLSAEDFASFKASIHYRHRHIDGRSFAVHRDAVRLLRRLRGAFNQLRRNGYLTRSGGWICCSSCGHAELAKQSTNGKWVFWHAQSHSNLIEDAEVYLAWSGDGDEICAALRETGLTVDWNGTRQRAIGVSLRLN